MSRHLPDIPDIPDRQMSDKFFVTPGSFLDRLRAFGAAFDIKPEEPVNIQQSDRRVERRARRILNDQPEWARPRAVSIPEPIGYAGRSEPADDEEI